MCRRQHSLAVLVDLGLHAVLVADVRHRSQESRLKLDFRVEAGVGLSVRGQHRALGRPILVGVLRLVFRTASHPFSLSREVRAGHVLRGAHD